MAESSVIDFLSRLPDPTKYEVSISVVQYALAKSVTSSIEAIEHLEGALSTGPSGDRVETLRKVVTSTDYVLQRSIVACHKNLKFLTEMQLRKVSNDNAVYRLRNCLFEVRALDKAYENWQSLREPAPLYRRIWRQITEPKY